MQTMQATAAKQPAVTATRKAWATRSGTLVEDGDPEAACLFARKGQRLSASSVAQFENAADFFSGIEGTAQGAPAGEREAKPRPKPSKAAKAAPKRSAGLF